MLSTLVLWLSSMCQFLGEHRMRKATFIRRTQHLLEWKSVAPQSVESLIDPGWAGFWSEELWCFGFYRKAGISFKVPAECSQERSYHVIVGRGGGPGFMMLTWRSDSPRKTIFTQLLCKRVTHRHIFGILWIIYLWPNTLGIGTFAVRNSWSNWNSDFS